MTTSNFLLVLMVGAALIAFWIVARFPERAPANFRSALLHVGAALIIGWFTPAILGVFLPWGRAAALAGIFGVLLPTTVYAFLASAWFLKVAHDTISHYRP